MAAVATEPGAAAIRSTATSDDGSPEPGSGRMPEGAPEPAAEPEPEPAAELGGLGAGDGGDADVEERRCRHLGPEPEPATAAGRVQEEAAGSGGRGEQVTPNRSGPERYSLGEAVSAQTAYRSGSGGGNSNCGGSSSSSSIVAQPKPTSSAVFLHSFPVPRPPAGAEAGLFAAEAAEPSGDTAGRGRAYAAVGQDAAPEEGAPCRASPKPDVKPGQASADASASCIPRLGAVQVQVQDLSLSLGSEVRVSLDHVIDDALVVSFRLGEKLFSGVLMDVSKRFGPYGIPVTPFPPRQDRSGARRAAPPEREATGEEDAPNGPRKPLFQEGAPYPPPLFIRDTYNQDLPQPPPRKIKRPKRRYRCEEPTSIMNAIKLRPRQVLCDKCKGAAAVRHAGPRDSRGEERRRKAAEGPVSAEVKRLRSDDRARGDERGGRGAERRAPPGTRAPAGFPSSPRAPSSSSSARLKPNSKKATQKGSDGAKKAARNSPPAPLGENRDREGKALTRAAALRKQKVHFTRRLQQLSAALVGPALPPRMRLKPQRYRTDEPRAPPSSSSSSSASPSSSSSPPNIDNARSGPDPSASRPPAPTSSFCAAPEEEERRPPPRPDLSEGVSALPPPPARLAAPPCPSAGDEEGERPERRRKSSTSSSSSSSSASSSSVFSKSVSKCQLPDGRAVCVGDIVWAKIYGFPWWPARVLGMTVARRADGAGRQEARVSWFGSPTTSFLPLAQLSPFLESFQSRFDRKRKGPYRRAISEAASAAKQLTPEVRALLTQFET
ncbi:PWWP domain-containing protein 2A [Corythoichthys intestinalis]|uniref:PWWP domain-containing protein 2A n=1 Tax=Corythoichthys intestinalis TaxID=161448 RepID=UPI0025A649AD|nr:PWWP domain-containing protein 2A [Corythoichthys intestinalis]XP_061801112.1 PWWP domain-containing protein 2A-like [Nerophis lumbriciformis]